MYGALWKIGRGHEMVMQKLLEKRQRLLQLAENREKRVAHKKEVSDEFHYLYVFIGNKLKEARINANITQEDLAAALGVQRTSIANIESGIQRLPIHKLFALAVLLDVPAKSLMPDDLEFF